MAITPIPLVPGEDGQHQQHNQEVQQPQPTHPPHPLHQHSLSDASTVTVDIEAWTIAALESLSIAPIARGTGNVLSIPLDAHPSTDNAGEMKLRGVAFKAGTTDDAYGASIAPPRLPLSRRDSMKKRDALVKGKEGSRQRRRWENGIPPIVPRLGHSIETTANPLPPVLPDHLLHVPNVQPPLPSDWLPLPTHRVLPPVPYQLAAYWDRLSSRPTKPSQSSPPGAEAEVGRVPRDLRNTAKRTPAVKSWLRVLEEPVREFVVEHELLVVKREEDGDGNGSDKTDTDDEEIVFVGRNGRGGIAMREGKPLTTWKKAQRQGVGAAGAVERGMVMEEMEDEAGGAFKCVFLFFFPSLLPSAFLSLPLFSFGGCLPSVILQALAHSLYFRLLRSRVQVGHGWQPCAARRLRRGQAEAAAGRAA